MDLRPYLFGADPAWEILRLGLALILSKMDNVIT